MSEDPVESGCLNCAGAGAFLTVGVLVLWACEVAEHLLGLSKGTVQTPGAFVAFVVAVMAAVKVERWVNSSQARREASADPRQRMRDAARLRGLVLDEDLIDRLLGELPNNRARYRALDRVRRALFTLKLSGDEIDEGEVRRFPLELAWRLYWSAAESDLVALGWAEPLPE